MEVLQALDFFCIGAMQPLSYDWLGLLLHTAAALLANNLSCLLAAANGCIDPCSIGLCPVVVCERDAVSNVLLGRLV